MAARLHETGEVQVQPIDLPKLVDANNGEKIKHGVILKAISPTSATRISIGYDLRGVKVP